MSMMIPDPEGYFRGFLPPRDQLLLELEEEAGQQGIPIVGPVVGELLYILARAAQARLILELGTATGYSTIYLARAAAELKGRVLTLERDQGLAAKAQANFAKAGLSAVVEVQVGEADDLLSRLQGPVDFIFMDIDKEGYLPALPNCQRLLKVGGLLVADNVGFQGAADFNREIFKQKEWRAVPLLCLLPHHSPEKDGLSFALRV
ncbi:MAG: class I SAM-dependent methyltransferase [Thermodesulfobacteriota bacterium]